MAKRGSRTLFDKATAINLVVNQYFQSHPSITEAKASDLMKVLVAAGIFKGDHRRGLPLRKVLRELDEAGLSYLIPLLRTEKKRVNKFWFFTTARHFEFK